MFYVIFLLRLGRGRGAKGNFPAAQPFDNIIIRLHTF